MSSWRRPGTSLLRGGFVLKKAKNKPAATNNVFEDLGFSPEESRILAVKAQLAALVVRIVDEKGLSQKKLAALWGVSQPRVSEVLTGKLALISIDRLLGFLGSLGCEVTIRPRASQRASRR